MVVLLIGNRLIDHIAFVEAMNYDVCPTADIGSIDKNNASDTETPSLSCPAKILRIQVISIYFSESLVGLKNHLQTETVKIKEGVY